MVSPANEPRLSVASIVRRVQNKRQNKKGNKIKMKKLMIAAAIAMMAVASQAASFVWEADGYEGTDWAGQYIGTTAQVNAFLYIGEVTLDKTKTCALDFSKAAEMYLTSDEQDGETYMFGNPETKLSSGNLKSDAAGQKYTIILAEVDALGQIPALSDGKHFALITGETTHEVNPMEESDTWAGMINKTILAQGDWKTWDSTSPTPPPIPEPTSAMLLLLGVAGLALRRKAK